MNRRLAGLIAVTAVLVAGLASHQSYNNADTGTVYRWFSGKMPPATRFPLLLFPAFNDVSANWKMAGLLPIGGIPSRSTQCGSTVSPSGVTPPSTVPKDDVHLIQDAIDACTAGQVVQLASGTFHLVQSEHIALNKGVTLRGTGSCTNGSSPYCQTEITVDDGALANWTISPVQGGTQCGVDAAHAANCTASTAVILVSPNANFDWGWSNCSAPATSVNPTASNCGTTLAVDAAQGATTVQVASTTGFTNGGWALIDEDPQLVTATNPTGGSSIQASAEFLNSSGSPAVMRVANPDTCGGFCPYSFVANSSDHGRVNQEIHKIASIGAGPCPGTSCTLTFDSPLTIAFRQSGSHDARVYWSTKQTSTPTPFLEQAGVENMTISRAGNGGINFVFTAYSWAKNVEIRNWIAGAINLPSSARDQIEGNYLHDCYDCENNGEEYPIGISSATTESYVVNNIILRGGKGMVGRASTANVIAYNYVDDTFYMNATIGSGWVDMNCNGSHYGGTHHWLFEGNWCPNLDGDETHGNAIYHTFFRNQGTGIRTTFTDPSQGQTVNDASNIGWGQAFSFTGSIVATTLNSGTTPLAVGSLIQGTGVTANTTITASLGGNNYTVSASQTVASETMYATPTATNGPLRAAGPMAFNYWDAYLANALGLNGVTDGAHGWTYQGANCGGGSCNPASTNKNIWMSGWVGGEWPNSDSNLNINASAPFIFKSGNYDYVHGSISDWATGYSQNLPNSLYLSSVPAFFNAGASLTYPWPWVTPASGTPIQVNSGGGSGNPAKARWDAGTPFSQP